MPSPSLPALSRLLPTTIITCAISQYEGEWSWQSLLLLGFALSTLGAWSFVAMQIRGMCVSTTESLEIAARMGCCMARTLFRFVFVRGGRPRFPKWTLGFELAIDVLRYMSERYGERITQPSFSKAMVELTERGGTNGGQLYLYFAGGIDMESVEFNGLEHIWLKSKTKVAASNRRVVLFFHGGGFSMMGPRAYIMFGTELMTAIRSTLELHGISDELSVDLLLSNYRKAPDYQFPAGPDDALAAYNYLLRHEELAPSQIIVAGDSAGACHALAMMQRVRDSTPNQQPLACALLSPCIDLDPSVVLEDHEAPRCFIAKVAALASFRAYTGGKRTSQYEPSDCDLVGLPPTFVQAGSLDCLFGHASRLISRAREQGHGPDEWEFDVHEGLPHDFTMFPSVLLPYASVGIARAADFMVHRFSASTAAPSSE